MPAGRKKKKKKVNAGTVSVGVIVLAFAVVMSIQIVKLKQKDDYYKALEAEQEQKLVEEQERATEIQELDEYVHSTEFVEDTAKSKLGLSYDNEIIFKEKKE